MEQDKDFKHLMNRIAFTTIVMLVLLIGYLFIKNNPDKVAIFNDEEMVYDTIQVKSNEGLKHEIIIGYHVEISYREMRDFNKGLYFENKREYFRRQLLIPVEDRIRTVVSNEIRFKDLDSIYMTSKKMYNVTSEAIREIAFNKSEDQNGLTVKSITLYFHFDPVLRKYIKRTSKQYP